MQMVNVNLQTLVAVWLYVPYQYFNRFFELYNDELDWLKIHSEKNESGVGFDDQAGHCIADFNNSKNRESGNPEIVPLVPSYWNSIWLTKTSGTCLTFIWSFPKIWYLH